MANLEQDYYLDKPGIRTLISELEINTLAEEYSSSATYAVGDYCMYNYKIYRCTTAISTVEAWNSAHWTLVIIGDELKTKKSGTVTQVKVGTTSYDPTAGVVSLPAYPTTLPASNTTSTYSATGTNPVNGTAVASALGTLDVTGASGIAASKTISAWSETDGKVSISTQDIAIANTQVSGLGTASTKDVPSSGNASTTQVVLGSDTRLSDSRTPTSHNHGNIQNGGTLQTNDITIANGDKLVVTDSSDSAKVARASISFDASTTTKALTPKGTFETFLQSHQTVTDNNPTLAWSTKSKVATIGGTDINVTMPANPNTDTKVTSAANHYAPATASGQDKTASASGATAAWSIDVVKGVTLNTDGKGHVTGISVTSGKIPANPNTDTTYTIGTSGDTVTLTPSPSGTVQSITTSFATNTEYLRDNVTTTYKWRYINSNDATTWTADTLGATTSLAILRANMTGGWTTGHIVTFNFNDVGTPFQIGVHDSSELYFYKRYKTSGTWGDWKKMNAGNADYATSSGTAELTKAHNITIQTGSSAQQKITLQTLMTWLITTKGYIPSGVHCYRVIETSWSYAGNDILQLGAHGTNYELQLAGVIIEFFGNATSYNAGVFRLRIHSSPTTSFTPSSGFTVFPTSHIAEYTCNGSGYSPTWKVITDKGDDILGNAATATTATKLGTSNVGSATNPIYLNAGTATACTYSLGATINAGTANQLAYYSGANAISSSANVYYWTAQSTASTPATRSILGVYGATYGNTAATMISGTAGVFSYGDGGPQIDFNTSKSGAQAGALIYTDNDSAATGASFHFVSNQTDWNVTSKRFHARTSISIGTDLPNTSYNLYVKGSAYHDGYVMATCMRCNITTSYTSGGLSLWGTSAPESYGIAMRQTGTTSGQLGKHGYVQGDYGTYLSMAAGTSGTRGWIFRSGSYNYASIDVVGNAVFNGSVTVGGNATNTSGARLEFDPSVQAINFVFV